jgi:hypothetical protein
VRGATWKAQVGQHQYVDLAVIGQRAGLDRLHEHQRLEQNPAAMWAQDLCRAEWLAEAEEMINL